MRGLGRHIWGETSSSSCTGWGKETIGNMVTPPRQGSLGTRSHASLEKMNKTRGNISKLIQARETLEKRDRVLTASIRRCHVELAKRKCLSEIEASKDAVEAAWNEFNHATARYCMHAGGDLSRKELDEQPEEARRAWYEWKAISNMMDEVVDKAEENLEESATRENYCDDEDSGNELDAEMEVRLWVEQLSIMSKVNEMALEVSAANEMNVNEVNVNTEAKEVCAVMNEMSKGKSLEIEAKVEVNEKSEEVVTAKPPNVLQRFDFTAKVQDKEVEILPPMEEVMESCHANWDPGELVDAKAQVEMLDAKLAEILVNDNKVGPRLSKNEARLRGDVNAHALFDVMLLFNLMRLYISEVLVPVARNAARFVDVNPLSSRCFAENFLPILSDYG